MRPVLNKIVNSCLLILAVGFSSCGTNDFLDEVGQRYTANIAIQDLDEDTLSIDVLRNYCNNDPNNLEPYGAATARVNIAVDANAPGVTLRGYTIEYIPLRSPDGTGLMVDPPPLVSPLRSGNYGIDIKPGGSATFEITCISVDTKQEYRLKAGYMPYWVTDEGQAEIAAKEADIAAKQMQIASKEAEIQAAITAGLDTTVLAAQLAALEEELDRLEADLALLFEFWSIPELDEARYKIRITFDFIDTLGESRTIQRDATVWFGNYDRC